MLMTLEGIDLQSFAQALSVPTQEALQALPQFQKQQSAWQFAFDLLASDNVNCRFFGAHTLQVKIARDWATLDEERQYALRSELIRLVVEQSDAPVNVLSKINQALSAYALHTVPDVWSNFLPSVIDEITERASNAGKSTECTGYAIIDLLELFPEELNRTALAITQHAKLIQDTKDSLPQVLDILTSVVRGLPGSSAVATAPEFAECVGRDPVWRARAWKAILQWLQFGVAGDTLFVSLLDLGMQQLEIMAAHQLNGSNAVDDDEIGAATTVLDDMASNTNMASKYAKTIGTLVLERTGQPWITDVLKQCIADNNDQRALQWGSTIVSFGETYTEFIVQKIGDPQLGEHISTFLQIMLALSRFPGYHGIDEDVSDQPLNFWYLLQEALVDFVCESQDDPELMQRVAETQEVVRQVYIELLKVLVSKCTYPPTDVWVDADKEERERFVGYRREVADALLNTYYVLREDMLSLLVEESMNNMRTFSLESWQNLEALLFALRSIGEAVPESEATFLPRLFSSEVLAQSFMPVLQASVGDDDRTPQWGLVSIKTSILSLIGAYGDWWKSHPGLLPVAVPCVTSSLSQPGLVQAAVAAFRRICDSCREQLTEASGSMVLLACEVLLAGDSVPLREQQRIFESVAEVIAAQQPDKQVESLTPLISTLAEVLGKGASLLESAPIGTALCDLEPYTAPLLNSLRLVDALARGLQFSDEVEETALVGEAESTRMLEYAAHCYRNSGALQEFRGVLLALLNRVFVLPVWPQDAQSHMVQMDETLVECILSTINNSSRRGPHALAFDFGDIVALIGNAWNATVARSEGVGGALSVLGSRWSDQCPVFLQCVSQLVMVFSTRENAWQLTRTSMDDVDRMLGAVLTRLINDIYFGISQEASALATAIEQQPVISEYAFDLCTRVLQTRPELFAHLERASIGKLCDLSLQALSIPNRLALKPTAYFLTALIRLSSSSISSNNTGRQAAVELIRALWSEYGVAWLRTTLAAIGGTHPRSLLPNLSELLFAMTKNHLATTRQWLGELLAQPGFPSAYIDDTTKRVFVQQIVGTRSFTRAKGIVNEFSIKCRNLQNAAYV
ncbi:hypothetical protein EV175_002790 [Coemansia sp. RSA 1933]|nr:hypothetical protein EV175_002790 [Coemansia sp. RSA 1933]